MQKLRQQLRRPDVLARSRHLRVVSGTMRFPILHLLCMRPEGLTVKELAEVLHASPSRVSHQLAILRRHRLIRPTKAGRTVSYTVEKQKEVAALLHV